ncbi:MAG: hypothetical protein FWD23_02595, partial [Oscillospiraceae bacterium]|nr:hypothetical protein [Oscillospiraceae bacterium]
DSVTDLGVRGNNLNIYDGCLYFLNEHNYLYKLDLSDANATPKGVTIEYIYAYMILDDKIYPSRFLSNVLSMNLDGSDLQEAQIDSFVIYGHDNEYIYVIYPDEKQTSMVDGREICVQYIYRMDYSHENKEKLFEVHNDVPNYFDELNGVMIISNGYAYYEIIDNDEWKLIRNLLTANPVRETIYSDETAFHIMAVTDEWIYVRQYIREDSGSYAFSVFKVSPDGKTKTEINFKKDDIPFFVGRFDNKLYYVENNKIFPFD